MGICAVAMVVATAQSAHAHPTDDELREAQAQREICDAEVPAGERLDPVHLGMSLAELREAVSGLRQEPEADGSLRESGESAPRPTRWVREASGELVEVEYELFGDRIYRIRWRLADVYERPILDALARTARRCFGRPDYDQTFEAEPGSAAATLRRIGWTHGERRIELRQLHPLRGGPIYLTVSSNAGVRELGAAGRAAFPEPTQSEPWWRRSMATLEPAKAAETEQRGQAFLRLLAQLDH